MNVNFYHIEWENLFHSDSNKDFIKSNETENYSKLYFPYKRIYT